MQLYGRARYHKGKKTSGFGVVNQSEYLLALPFHGRVALKFGERAGKFVVHKLDKSYKYNVLSTHNISDFQGLDGQRYFLP
jgi:hypothetical protein